MSNVAILIGNATYDRLPALACCRSDVIAVTELIKATGRYDEIRSLEDASADDIRSQIRDLLSTSDKIEEFLFYFSGHGFQRDAEFYFCAKSFDPARPNDTGLSHDELSNLMRSGNPELAVKIIDACSSGSPLIKGDFEFLPIEKGGFRNVIQIASCLDNQSSLTGEPLSEFTEALCHAALGKSEGPTYYSDIINSLRDEYIDNDARTPHFVSQGTGREVFITEGSLIDEFRSSFFEKWFPEENEEEEVASLLEETLLSKLIKSEEKYPAPEAAEILIQKLFDGISQRLIEGELSELFSAEIAEHSDYKESTTRAFIIRSLSKEPRPDNFVTATISRSKKSRPAWQTSIMAGLMPYDDAITEDWDLSLNCYLKRAQLRITLSPKFTALQQIRLVVTVAPSLHTCYVFELATQHPRTDWKSFDPEGREIIRNWYKQSWHHEVDWLIDGIRDRILIAAREHVEKAAGSLDS